MRNPSGMAASFLLLVTPILQAGVGDPQVRTDHPWYPGELACSTFERLFATQADVYQRVVGTKPTTDEQKALAAWLWRNTHYWHGEEGVENLWGKGFGKGPDLRTREYWTGLFAHGFGLCGTTHSQWVAEMNALLGHGRGRGVGVEGHNSFEVFLTGGPYGKGKWALLDHDISTVVFDDQGQALLSAAEVQKDWKKLTSRGYLSGRQPWLVCGLHPGDGSSYQRYQVAEYLAGYSGPPPLVNLRRGETLRRYFEPGLEDGKTFVFWGRNYNTGGVPGPERSITWVNQPDRMYGSKDGAGFKPGQARFANAVYTYRPDFASGDYKEGVRDESPTHVAFEFYSPYIIGASPASSGAWGIYEPGCRNGLVLRGKAGCAVSVSTDQGKTWQDSGKFQDGMDLTDLVKGHRQYFLKLHTSVAELKDANLTITTVCQANASILPRLKDNGTTVDFLASKRGIVSAGPNLPQAEAHVVAGRFGSPKVTLEVESRLQTVRTIYAAAHVLSSNPPSPTVKYQMDYSTDAGKTWQPLVKDWTIARRGQEPSDFWSQSMFWGSVDLKEKDIAKVQVRFHNNGGKSFARGELHLVYDIAKTDATRVTCAWSDDRGPQQASHVFAAADKQASFTVPTSRHTRTRWVELEPVKR